MSKGSDMWPVLFIMQQFTMMADLLDYFDYDDEPFLRFVDMFGGMTLTVPTRDEIAKSARDYHVMRTLEADSSASSYARLKDLYGIEYERLRQIWKLTAQKCRRIQDG